MTGFLIKVITKAVFGAAIWCTLSSDFQVVNGLIGFFISFMAVIFTHVFIKKTDEGEIKDILKNIKKYAIYIPVLFYNIFKSGFSTLRIIFNGTANVGIIDIKTDLKRDFDRMVLANSITLTPGTVTIELSGDNLKVLWLNKTTQDPERAAELIKGKFEKILADRG